MMHDIRIRRDYSRVKSVNTVPNLIEIQKESYRSFLQKDTPKDQRKNEGLQAILSSVFPISSSDGRFVLEFVDYHLENPKYDINECRHRGANYASALKVRLRLITNEIDKGVGLVSVSDVKEQEVHFCEFPLMTDRGTFVINGTERVIVSQIYRSPGVFFDQELSKTHEDKYLYSASIIPKIGSWLDIEFDNKDLLFFRIDKRKKIPLTTLLRSLEVDPTFVEESGDDKAIVGMSNEEILKTFYEVLRVDFNKKNGFYELDFSPTLYLNTKLPFDLVDVNTKEILVKEGVSFNSGVLKKIGKLDVKKVLVPLEGIQGKFFASPIYDIKGDKLVEEGDEVTSEVIDLLKSHKFSSFDVLNINVMSGGSYILDTLLNDRLSSRFRALNEIYKVIKLASAPNLEVAEDLIHSLFFDVNRYDLSPVGRMKLNECFKSDIPESQRVLLKEDVISIVRKLLLIKDGHASVDDIDHLGNRRVRSVGEIVENEIRISFVRSERNIKEKLAVAEGLMPGDIVNVRAMQSVLREFFGTSQLSQFMDQTNPLSEVTHKRRISALGPKGLNRDRASFEARDVHFTHYGRICPIETPEGPNIGLINSLSMYAKINNYGFLETPYFKVLDGKITDEIVYMSATQEFPYKIAQATTKIQGGNFVSDQIVCRFGQDIVLCSASEVDYIDVSAKQMISVAASLVPFLENNDANRALMGANMQRQAVPLLKAEAPIVATGTESLVVKASGVSVFAKRYGIVHKVQADKVLVEVVDPKDHSIVYDIDVYNLAKFQKSNHSTCVNQIPLVREGDVVHPGDLVADGQSTDNGELALGKNVLVAFMPWNGYNFEDSILISERLVREDTFTSIHIEEFEIVARDTKLGPEEITADIPNIGEEALKNIDEAGIIFVGSKIQAGDLLVGKVTPKAESMVTAEEKLLRAIFGEKASDVKDSSLRVPAGIRGTVIGVRVFSRRGIAKDVRSQFIERSYVDQLTVDTQYSQMVIENALVKRLSNLLDGQEVVSASKYKKGTVLKGVDLSGKKLAVLLDIVIADKKIMTKFKKAVNNFNEAIERINQKYENDIHVLQSGDDLPSGILKVVKVYVAVKRKLQPGDKMAGRHGNKGVVSKIVPVEDMPYLEDGTPVDVCLNPLGVPSRMNVGQILEVHCGWACANIGKKVDKMLSEYRSSKDGLNNIRAYLAQCYGEGNEKFINNVDDSQLLQLADYVADHGISVVTSAFDGIKEQDIDDLFHISGCEDTSGQVTLIDGKTGEPFHRKVTIGYIYMLKLHHLVDDKIHARSIGPYSLITQQPLGGKAQFGGQRFGEMEVWALEAYGAAYTLREMLTVKSDDQVGRTHVYESIIKGDETFETNIPESFNVLAKELRSLCLNLEMKNQNN